MGKAKGAATPKTKSSSILWSKASKKKIRTSVAAYNGDAYSVAQVSTSILSLIKVSVSVLIMRLE